MRSPVLVSPVWPKMAVVPLEGPGSGRRARAEVPVPRELLETKLVVPKEVAKDLVSVVLKIYCNKSCESLPHGISSLLTGYFCFPWKKGVLY